jgi:hypothetical protein
MGLRMPREDSELRVVSGPRNQHQQALVQVRQEGLAQRSLVDSVEDLVLLRPVAMDLVRSHQLYVRAQCAA